MLLGTPERKHTAIVSLEIFLHHHPIHVANAHGCRCTHCAPIFTHSAHSRRSGSLMVVMAERWLQLPLDIIHIVFKYSCTNWTAIDPSPTAEATRLTEPERTSPAANTPGRLVSNKNGCRFKVQCRESPSSIPVRTKCFSSFSISDGNQSVRGVAPMKLKRAAIGSVSFSPVVLFKISTELK